MIDDTQAKKRLSYEFIVGAKTGELDHMNLEELERYRQKLLIWMANIASMTKEEGIKESRRKYLIGLRNYVIIKLIGEVKKRKKAINIQVCNGSKSDVMRRFMRKASEILPHDIFQKIYGYAIREQSEIDDGMESQ